MEATTGQGRPEDQSLPIKLNDGDTIRLQDCSITLLNEGQKIKHGLELKVKGKDVEASIRSAGENELDALALSNFEGSFSGSVETSGLQANVGGHASYQKREGWNVTAANMPPRPTESKLGAMPVP